MRHFNTTAYGDSESSYGEENSEKPLQGAIQSNDTASPIFVAISCVLLQFLNHMSLAFIFRLLYLLLS